VCLLNSQQVEVERREVFDEEGLLSEDIPHVLRVAILMGVRRVPAYGCGGAVSSGVSAAGVASSAGVLCSGGSDGGGGGGGLEGGGVVAGVYGVVACWGRTSVVDGGLSRASPCFALVCRRRFPSRRMSVVAPMPVTVPAAKIMLSRW
jgi:hypothetical protein